MPITMPIVPNRGSTQLINNLIDGLIKPNQLLSGEAVWVSGLDFFVTDCAFTINGVLYTSEAETVTLDAADGSNPRIDVIVVNTDGTASVVTGTAAATPVKPEIDSDTQIEVTFALVATSATAPSNISNEDVYLENAEWTYADSGATINPDDVSDPYAGTKAIKFTTAVNNNYVTLTDSGTHSAIEFDRLFFYIKNTVAYTGTTNRMRIALYNQTLRVSSWIDLRHGTFGFSGSDTANYQLISLPIVTFALNGNSFDRIRLQIAAGSGQSLSFLLDNIKLQIGAPSFDSSDFAKLSVHNDWQAAQGTGIVILTDAATVSWDMAPSNVYQLTLGGNRTIAAPSNVKPGYPYNLFLIQGAGGQIPVWNAVFKWADDIVPTLSTGAGDIDILSFIADASGNLHGALAIANSS